MVDPDLLDETLRLHTRNHEPSTSVPQPGSLFCKSPKRPTKARVRPPLSIPTPSRTSTLYARTVALRVKADGEASPSHRPLWVHRVRRHPFPTLRHHHTLDGGLKAA